MKLSFKTLFDVFQTTRLWLLILRTGVLLAFITVAFSLKLSLVWYALPLAYLIYLLWSAYDHLNNPLRFFSALILDIAVIAFVLMLSDGVMSGWVSFLILPALIGCLSLSRIYAWLVALFSVACYGLLIWGSADPEYISYGQGLHNAGAHHHADFGDHDMADMERHMWGMWLTFSISITLMTGFLVQQRTVASVYQQSMMKLQQQFAREQQIMAVASLTANTTHQLASPISTARLLLEELQDDELSEPDKARNLQLIEQELNRCAVILDNMMAQTSETSLTGESQAVEFVPWFNDLLQTWWNGHNEIELHTSGEPECYGAMVNVDQNLTFAFNNVLDNISKAISADDRCLVEIMLGAIDSSAITIEIRYSGSPPSGDVIEFLGKRIVKSQDGMGIGALLAQTAIERLKGSLEYFWYDDRQCTVSILLPLQKGKY